MYKKLFFSFLFLLSAVVISSGESSKAEQNNKKSNKTIQSQAPHALKKQKHNLRNQTLPYCCCSDTNCVSGDGHHCCSHSEHPIAVGDCAECSGVSMNGDLLTNPNTCGNSTNVGQPCD